MTFDNAVNTDFGTMLGDLRDKATSLAGYSLFDSSTNGDAASVSTGEWFVIANPHGEHIKFEFIQDGQSGLLVEYGAAWDDTNDTWSDRYGQDPHSRMEQHLSYETHSYLMACTNGIQETDAVTYWMEYVGTGFVTYWQREQGDGADRDAFIGFEDITQLWDYDTAASREANQAFFYGGELGDNGYNNAQVAYLAQMAVSGRNPVTKAKGAVNPDNNFNNYPYTDGVFDSGSYRNSAGFNTIIGKYEMAIHDRSGGDASHRDTVQDGGGTNVYTLLKRNASELGMRMD